MSTNNNPNNQQAGGPTPPAPVLDLKIEDMENQIKDLMTSIQKQDSNQTQALSAILTLQQQLTNAKENLELEKVKYNSLKDRVSWILDALKKNIHTKYRSIEDIPGIRIPRWYDVNLEFTEEYYDFNNVSSQFVPALTATVSVSPDGPFIVTQITPLVQVTSRFYAIPVKAADYSVHPEIGRILPASAYSNIVNNLGRTNTSTVFGYNSPSLSQLDAINIVDTDLSGVLQELDEFDVQIKINGNGRLYTNTPVSTAGLYAFKGLPFFTGIAGIFEKSDRISVTATLKTKQEVNKGTIDNPAPYGTKRLKICFHGYQILNPIIVSDLLGY